MDLKFENVSFSYEKPLFKQVNLKINLDKPLAIVGKSASGKSTLVSLIKGLISPTSGRITVGTKANYKDIKRNQKQELKAEVGLVFQMAHEQLFGQTVLDDVMFGLINYNIDKDSAKSQAKTILEQLNFNLDLLNHDILTLSGGEKRKVALAGILVMKPKVLIVDEPTIGLDPKSKEITLDFIVNYCQENQMKLIIVSHDIDIIDKYTNQILHISSKHQLTLYQKQEYYNYLYQKQKWELLPSKYKWSPNLSFQEINQSQTTKQIAKLMYEKEKSVQS